jgi:hypothetical protein
VDDLFGTHKDSPKRKYHGTAKVITSGGNRNPASAEVGMEEVTQRAARMHQA